MKEEKTKDSRINDSLVIGRNAVTELLKSGKEVENVLIAKGEREGSINRILAPCHLLRGLHLRILLQVRKFVPKRQVGLQKLPR